MRGFVDHIFEMLSGEYLLTRLDLPNGGTVVFLRAAHVTVFFFALALVLLNAVDPARTGPPTWTETGRQIADRIEWLGVIFGSAYAALYARFASQWAYLAGVYNSLKAAQAASGADPKAIAEWRAGFIEDCEDLHLLRKPMFASIVHGLLSGKDEHALAAQAAFDSYAPGGCVRRERIEAIAAEVAQKAERRYSRTSRAIAPAQVEGPESGHGEAAP